MKSVIFARGNNISQQIEQCKEYAEAKGYKVEGVLVGQGIELPEMIKGLGTKIDRVIVKDMSRISRNALECYTIQADIELCCGTSVEVATDIPRSEAFENFMKNIIMAVKEEECIERERIEKRFNLMLNE